MAGGQDRSAENSENNSNRLDCLYSLDGAGTDFSCNFNSYSYFRIIDRLGVDGYQGVFDYGSAERANGIRVLVLYHSGEIRHFRGAFNLGRDYLDTGTGEFCL